jgi:ABC-type glycerol-3-phosphate transport system substrate-binding protein
MDVMEQIITPGFVFNGSNALVFTDAQTYFLNDRAAMMVNGSWMINEMKVHLNEKQDFSMMPTPVISSIIEKVPDRSISNDKELSALITAIDNANSVDDVALSGKGYEVTKADLERVFDARHVMHSNFNEHGMIIPKYAVAKEGAKKFIQYFYSDENIKMYHNVTHMTIPIQYSDGSAVDTTGWRDWEIQQQKFTDKNMTFFDQNANTSKLFTAGGCQFYGGVDFISAFCNPDSGQRLSSEKAWNQMVAIWDANWNNYKSNAQL